MDVRKNMLSLIERLKKRIIVTSFASNVARMESVFYCAEQTGRQISLVGRSMHRIFKAARECGYLKNVIEYIYEINLESFIYFQHFDIILDQKGLLFSSNYNIL